MSELNVFEKKIWEQLYGEKITKEIDFQDILMTQYLENSTKKFPNSKALIFQGYELTFSQLSEMVAIFSSAIKGLGIKKGDRFAILLPNVIPCVAAYYAILKVGGIVVFNNPLYSDRELEYQLSDSGATFLITLDLLVNRMVKLREKTSIKTIIYTSIGDYLPFFKRMLFPFFGKKKGLYVNVPKISGVYSFKALLGMYPPDYSPCEANFDDVAMYQYTGGTTGISKGVKLTHRNISYQIQQIDAWFPTLTKGKEVILGALPFFHVFGLSTSMNYGIRMGWANVLVPKPQASPLLKAIDKYKVTFLPMVPTMYISLLEHPDMEKTDLTQIKACFSGSSPLPGEILNAFRKKIGAPIVEGYGLTETTPVTHVNPFYGNCKEKSIGLPLPHTECRIVDIHDETQIMKPNEPGELLIRGPQVMKSYLNRPEETKNVFTQDGFLHTGDVAKMDEEGYFFVVDRIKDMIVSGGYNVYPRDIDEVLFEHPKIMEACCVGIPHHKRGEALKAFVVLKQDQEMNQEEVIEYCEEKLAKYKLPVAVEFRKSLPKSTVGKILRKDLRAEELLINPNGIEPEVEKKTEKKGKKKKEKKKEKS